jgi:hypothetical protein
MGWKSFPARPELSSKRPGLFCWSGQRSSSTARSCVQSYSRCGGPDGAYHGACVPALWPDHGPQGYATGVVAGAPLLSLPGVEPGRISGPLALLAAVAPYSLAARLA